MRTKFAQLARPLIIVFVIVNALLIVFRTQLELKGIDAEVVIIANLILFAISMLNIFFAAKNMANPNPRAVVRGVMAGTLLKLVIVAASVLIYLVVAGAHRNRGGVFLGMALYVIYTLFEVKISLRLNTKK